MRRLDESFSTQIFQIGLAPTSFTIAQFSFPSRLSVPRFSSEIVVLLAIRDVECGHLILASWDGALVEQENLTGKPNFCLR